MSRRQSTGTWIVIASGNSLKEKDCEKVKIWKEKGCQPPGEEKTKNVIVINTTFRRALWADVLYACDGPWWDEYIDEVKCSFTGNCWTQDLDSSARYNLSYIEAKGLPGLGKEKIIHTGENGGYQAINLVYLLGASKIILLGMDMMEVDGESHWHGNHPGYLNRNSPYSRWVKNFDSLARDLYAAGVDVVNATRTTALNCFKKVNLEDVLCQ
ncbi:MAG: hypothetical protein KAJ18_11160 [Candidatus Omnitrophica bacterium]|nr:hypothetical protein [Candidatus Omnitrophota bacterium]